MGEGLGTIAWAMYQGMHRGERTTRDLSMETVERCLGSHDDDIPVRERCYAGWHEPTMTRNHPDLSRRGDVEPDS